MYGEGEGKGKGEDGNKTWDLSQLTKCLTVRASSLLYTQRKQIGI